MWKLAVQRAETAIDLTVRGAEEILLGLEHLRILEPREVPPTPAPVRPYRPYRPYHWSRVKGRFDWPQSGSSGTAGGSSSTGAGSAPADERTTPAAPLARERERAKHRAAQAAAVASRRRRPRNTGGVLEFQRTRGGAQWCSGRGSGSASEAAGHRGRQEEREFGSTRHYSHVAGGSSVLRRKGAAA